MTRMCLKTDVNKKHVWMLVEKWGRTETEEWIKSLKNVQVTPFESVRCFIYSVIWEVSFDGNEKKGEQFVGFQFGGVLDVCVKEQGDSGSDQGRRAPNQLPFFLSRTVQDQPFIKAGYCVKQGAVVRVTPPTHSTHPAHSPTPPKVLPPHGKTRITSKYFWHEVLQSRFSALQNHIHYMSGINVTDVKST